MNISLTPKQLERFWSKVDKSSDCWLWTAGISSKGGTGKFRLDSNTSTVSSHKLAWELENGKLPDDAALSNVCGNRACVCPSHWQVVNVERFETIEQRFWSKVDQPVGENSCWRWAGIKDKNGYGWFKHKGVMLRSNRLAYKFSKGEIGEDLFVCHSCDTPECCNPSHLFLGTPQDNMDDKVRKGRLKVARGERHGNSVLTEEQIREIRTLAGQGVVQSAIAQQFGISQTGVSKIVRKCVWKHVN